MMAVHASEPRVRFRTIEPAQTRSLLSAAGHDGAVGRNTFRAAGLATVDFSLTRSVPFGEHARLQFRAEAFNILNRSNFAIPVRILEAPGFGSSTRTLTPARMIQLALKVSF